MGCKNCISQGNSIGVSLCSNATAYEETFTTGWCCRWNTCRGATTVNVSGGGSVGDGGAKYSVGDIVYFQETDGQQYEVTAITNDALTIKQLDNPNGGGLKSALADGTDVRRRWRFYDLFDAAPGTSTYATGKGLVSDEMHVVVFDRTGDISGFRWIQTVKEQTLFLKHSLSYHKQNPLRLHRVEQITTQT